MYSSKKSQIIALHYTENVNIIYLNSNGCCLLFFLMAASVLSSSPPPRNWLAGELRGLLGRTLRMTFWLSARLFESLELHILVI